MNKTNKVMMFECVLYYFVSTCMYAYLCVKCDIR